MKLALLAFLACAAAQLPCDIRPPNCTDQQVGQVVTAIASSTNLTGCTKDSGYNWATFFNTTDSQPTDKQVQTSKYSVSCNALLSEVHELKVPSCIFWYQSFAYIVKQKFEDWAIGKHLFTTVKPKFIPWCSQKQKKTFYASLKSSKHLHGCSKASGFDWSSFFSTDDAFPTQTQYWAALKAKECLAFVDDVQQLEVEQCAFWMGDTSTFISRSIDAWVSEKITYKAAYLMCSNETFVPSVNVTLPDPSLNATNGTISIPNNSSSSTGKHTVHRRQHPSP
ncbi:hypothetical protein LEN26_017578 [Aphanomyces euteiches]|nr:hypothetical protein LEN26_017578 [Aphanomyces euteiches]KAH9114587.1 hypothetical protein AeMF1_011337 [Aphanomyces euteiches]KAH9182979.1 hypothetical protein AeNC1_015044 [Aphanomyces euteiches]